MADQKGDKPQRLAVFFCAREVAAGEPQLPPIRGIRAKLFDNAHYGDILKSVPGVFSAGYYRLGCIFSDGRNQSRLGSLCCFCREVNRAVGRAMHVSELQGDLGLSGGASDVLNQFVGIVPGDLRSSIHDKLRRSGRGKRELPHILILALIDIRKREGIFPTLMIPVSDVFAEHDHPGIRNIILRVELRENIIGWRAVGTAFGGEELDQNGLGLAWRCWRSLLGKRDGRA